MCRVDLKFRQCYTSLPVSTTTSFSIPCGNIRVRSYLLPPESRTWNGCIQEGLCLPSSSFMIDPGPVVRTAPVELSYIKLEALKTIYRNHQPAEGFRKNQAFFQPAKNGVHSILTNEGGAHSRVRRTLSPAFSDKALSEQRGILQHFTGLLIHQLREKVTSSNTQPINLFEWYIWTTFDLIGEMSFGEPFDYLKHAQFTEWVGLVFNAFKMFAFINIR